MRKYLNTGNIQRLKREGFRKNAIPKLLKIYFNISYISSLHTYFLFFQNYACMQEYTP